MKWLPLTKEEEIESIGEESRTKPVVIFKHSTTCSISRMAISRLEREHAPDNIIFYYLDLLRYRQVSNKVAAHYHVHHESPQMLLIRNGECVYDESHNGIRMDELIEQISLH